MLSIVAMGLLFFWSAAAVVAAIGFGLRLLLRRYTIVHKSAVVGVSVVHDDELDFDRLYFLVTGRNEEEVKRVHAMVASVFPNSGAS